MIGLVLAATACMLLAVLFLALGSVPMGGGFLLVGLALMLAIANREGEGSGKS